VTAAKTARDALARFATAGAGAAEAAVDRAIRAAHRAVCSQRYDRRGEPPGTTIVCAFVRGARLVVGWVGDSRAYWITKDGAALLTRDHSWVHDVVARRVMSETDALRHPLAHALTRCLGPLEAAAPVRDVEPEVIACPLRAAGHVVLCTDGLWTYYRDPASLGRLVAAAGEGASAARIARHLVNSALVRGGADNVSVAIYAHPGG